MIFDLELQWLFVTVTSETPKYSIEIEGIKTPKGLVPTVESLKRIVNGLNLLDADLARMNLKMEANIRVLLREVKTLQKLVADDTIASESSVERLGSLSDRFNKLESSLQKLAEQKPEAASSDAISELQKELAPTLAQAVQRLEEMIVLLEKRLEEFLRELQNNILLTVRQAVSSESPKRATEKARKTG
jgi:DNA anti-recombination protein RmuC